MPSFLSCSGTRPISAVLVTVLIPNPHRPLPLAFGPVTMTWHSCRAHSQNGCLLVATLSIALRIASLHLPTPNHPGRTASVQVHKPRLIPFFPFAHSLQWCASPSPALLKIANHVHSTQTGVTRIVSTPIISFHQPASSQSCPHSPRSPAITPYLAPTCLLRLRSSSTPQSRTLTSPTPSQ